MKRFKQHFRSLNDSDDGVAGIIVALLLIGLIMSAFALIQTVYVPKWMAEKEAEHMDLVATQISQFKFSVDTLSLLEKENSAISAPITLGSKELPFLLSSRAYGSIVILPNEFNLIVTDYNGMSISYTLGALKYSSDNAYYLDQAYIYEAGGVILSQERGEIVFIKPSIFLTATNDLSFDLVKLVETGGKPSASGYGTYPVQTKFAESETIRVNNIKQIAIYNSHLEAWYMYFDNLLSDMNNLESIKYTPDNDGIIITFSELSAVLPDLDLKVSEIHVQISLGWIE